MWDLEYSQGQIVRLYTQFVTRHDNAPIDVSDALVTIYGSGRIVVLPPTPMIRYDTGFYSYDYLIPITLEDGVYYIEFTGTVSGTLTRKHNYLQVLKSKHNKIDKSVAIQAFNDRDEAKKKLRTANETIEKLQREYNNSLETMRQLGLIEDIEIKIGEDSSLSCVGILQLINYALTKDKIISRIDCPAKIVSDFLHFGKSAVDEPSSKDLEKGLFGHMFSFSIYLDNHIIPFKDTNIKERFCLIQKDKKEELESFICRIYMKNVITEAPSDWMINKK